jgi:hypothetical protein
MNPDTLVYYLRRAKNRVGGTGSHLVVVKDKQRWGLERSFPKFRHTMNDMSARRSRIAFLALLLALIFVAGQLHFCQDLTPDPASSHVCPLCTTAGAAISTSSPNMAIAPVVHHLEDRARTCDIAAPTLRDAPPRAPPLLLTSLPV